VVEALTQVAARCALRTHDVTGGDLRDGQQGNKPLGLGALPRAGGAKKYKVHD
jgi:hypothetical protein